VNVTGPAVPQTALPPIKLPLRLAGLPSKPVSSSAGRELNVFLSLLSAVIDKNPLPLPSAPLAGNIKSTEAKSEKQSSAPAGQPIIFEAPQFTPIASHSNDPHEGTKADKQSSPAPDEVKTIAQRSIPSPRTIDTRSLTPDVAFGLRLTKNQPATEDVPTTVDGSHISQSAPDLSTGGVASPPTPPHPEAAEVFTVDNGTIPRDLPHPVRSESGSVRTPAPEKAMPPTAQHHRNGGNNSGNDQKEQRDSAQPFTAKQNQAAVARNDGQLPANSGTGEVSTRQFEIARTAEPQAGRATTNPNDSRKVVSGPEINPTLQPQPARQISLKLTGPDSTKVDLLLTERAGKMQIAVRTGDHALAKSMQTDLTELVGRLENKGFKAEAWIPTSGRHVEAVAAPQPFNQGSRQNHQQQSGGSSQQQQRQGQNQSNQRKQANWKAQLEETSSTEQTRTQNL